MNGIHKLRKGAATELPDQSTETSSADTTADVSSKRIPAWQMMAISSLLVACGLFCVWRIYPIFSTHSATSKPTELTRLDWQEAMVGLDSKDSTLANSFIVQSTDSPVLHGQRSLLQGRLFLEQGKLFAARQALLEALQEKELVSITNYWLGAVHYAMRDIATAEQYWLLSLEGSPNNADIHRSLSMVYYDRGAIDHAVHHLRQIAQLAPQDARPYRLLGLIHKDYERYEESIEFYRSALARTLTPETRQEVLHEMAQCLIKTREYDECLRALAEALPTPANRVVKSDALVGLGRTDEATAVLAEVLEEAPDNFEALVAKAALAMDEQQASVAVDLLTRAVALQRTDYLANFRLSQALRADGKSQLAEEAAAKAEELKKLREKFTQLHKDAAARPVDAEVRFSLGEVAEQLDMQQLAFSWYRAAVELDPSHLRAKEKLTSLQSDSIQKGL